LGAEISAAISYEDGTFTFVPIHDLSGHVRIVLHQGMLEEELDYTATGLAKRTRWNPSSITTPWTFASKRHDPTELIYFGRRYYDQDTSSWLTPDPIGYTAGPNLYAYVSNNPLTGFDLYGLIEQSQGSHEPTQSWGEWFMSGFSGGSPRTESSATERSSETPDPIILHDGTTIQPDTHYQDQVLVYPHGNTQDFVKENQKKNLGKRGVVKTINGMRTTLHTACERAEKIMNKDKEIIAVIILYNATEGIVSDSAEALCNIKHIPTSVVTTLKNELFAFYETCIENDISFRATTIEHSQGAAIGDNIFSRPEFGEQGRYNTFINKIYTLGGAVQPYYAINYEAKGDRIPTLSSFTKSLFTPPCQQLLSMYQHPQGPVRYISGSDSKAHSYEGEAYQKALDEIFAERNGVVKP